MALMLAPAWTQAKLNVVATLPDLASIAGAIGGDHTAVISLARPMEDPHFVDAKPSLIVKLNRAEVLIENGAGLESGWLAPLLRSARNAAIMPGAPGHVLCNRGVAMMAIPSELDRSKGDIHAEGNPHYLMDPLNAKIVATNIAAAFCRLDAAHAASYQAGLKAFADRIDSRMPEWKAALAPFAGSRLLTYHDSWVYFARRFDLRTDLQLEPKPGIPPSPSHLAGLIETMNAQNVRVILLDSHLNRRTADTVARNTGARVVEVTQFPGGVKGTEGGYIAMMDYLVNTVVAALKGN
jgi:zinc/manganese transport system substrate-binding protein